MPDLDAALLEWVVFGMVAVHVSADGTITRIPIKDLIIDAAEEPR